MLQTKLGAFSHHHPLSECSQARISSRVQYYIQQFSVLDLLGILNPTMIQHLEVLHHN